MGLVGLVAMAGGAAQRGSSLAHGEYRTRGLKKTEDGDCRHEAGWWYTYPSEKHESVGMILYSQLNGKIKKVPKHQPGGNSGDFMVISSG